MATCWNGCFKRLMTIWFTLHKTTTLQTWMFFVLSKTFLQIILAAKWFVRHSITSPNQQRQPLTSLLYLFFFYAYHVDPILIYRGHNSCSLDPIHGHRHLEHTSSDTPSNGNPRLTYKRYTVYCTAVPGS